MPRTKRALSAIVTTAVVSGGLVLAPAPAGAAEPSTPPSAVAHDLLDLDLFDLLDFLQTPPQLSGDPLGGLLTATAPVWGALPVPPELLQTDVTWLCNGVPIPGAEGLNFLPTEAQAGCLITVQTVTSVLGMALAPVELLTNALQLPGVGGETAVEPDGAPTIRADQGGKVGSTLTVSVPPSWKQTEVTTTYQWLRGGSPIGGANGTTYRLVAADLDKPITVRATGRKADHTDGTADSNAITAVLGDAPTAITQPAIQGSPKVGGTLTVNPGAWGAGDVPTYTYEWRRDNTPIAGATGATYRSVAADVGHTLTVTVTATRPGYRPGTFRTAGVEVQKLGSSLTASLPKRSVKQGKPASIRLLLTVPDGIDVGGPVTIYDGAKAIRKATVGDTPVTVKLGKLKPGTHRLKAVYAGSDTVESATSEVVKLKVVKKKKPKKK